MTRVRTGLAIAAGLGLISSVLAGTAATARAEDVTATPTASATATPSTPVTAAPPASPSPTAAAEEPTVPVAAQLRTDVPLDKKSTISVDVAPGRVSARFRSSIVRKRPVSLQRRDGAAWVEIKRSRMDSKGRVSFRVGSYQPDSVYRAVALRYKVKKKLAPLRSTKPTGWNLTFSDAFTGGQLDEGKWTHRPSEGWGARLCSRTLPEMYTLRDGQFVASVDYESDPAVANRLDANARKVQAAAGLPVVGCLNGASATNLGVFRSAMITTKDRFAINTAKPGMVATRVKFPVDQGMHGAVWLQTSGQGEVDMIEGFGYGRGISNYIHTPSRKTLDSTGTAVHKLGAYVLAKSTRKRSWWAQFHTYSVQWDARQFVFRVDGSVTQRIRIKPGDVDYSLIISLLISDWEAYRITSPVKTKGFSDVKPVDLPVEMPVDWVRVWQKR
ncbi:MAG TPA: family 16 glycosylhydrolase [Propionicimonas sp.]